MPDLPEEQLAELESRYGDHARNIRINDDEPIPTIYVDPAVVALIAEVRRSRKENALTRELVEASVAVDAAEKAWIEDSTITHHRRAETAGNRWQTAVDAYRAAKEAKRA